MLRTSYYIVFPESKNFFGQIYVNWVSFIFSGHMVHHVRMGSTIKKCVNQLPSLDLEASIQPITRTVLRVRLTITPDFLWDDKVIVYMNTHTQTQNCSFLREERN